MVQHLDSLWSLEIDHIPQVLLLAVFVPPSLKEVSILEGSQLTRVRQIDWERMEVLKVTTKSFAQVNSRVTWLWLDPFVSRSRKLNLILSDLKRRHPFEEPSQVALCTFDSSSGVGRPDIDLSGVIFEVVSEEFLPVVVKDLPSQQVVHVLALSGQVSKGQISLNIRDVVRSRVGVPCPVSKELLRQHKPGSTLRITADKQGHRQDHPKLRYHVILYSFRPLPAYIYNIRLIIA